MKFKCSHIAAALLAGILLMTGCSDTETYTVEDTLTMFSRDYNPGGRISMKKLNRYRIVYEDALGENGQALACTLRDAIAAKTGITLEIASDLAGYDSGKIAMHKYEIVLGNAFRFESNDFLEDYWRKAEGWNVVSRRLIIRAGDDNAGLNALVQKFITEVVDNITPEDSAFFDSDTDAYLNKNGEVEGLLLNGDPITDYVLVPYAFDNRNAEDSRWLTEILQQQLAELCGDRLPILSSYRSDEDLSEQPHIIVGVGPNIQEELELKFDELFGEDEKELSPNTWNIEWRENGIALLGHTSYAAVDCLEAFLEDLRRQTAGMTAPAAIIPSGPLVDDITQTGEIAVTGEIEMLYADFGGDFYDNLKTFAYECCPDLLVCANLDSWLFSEMSIWREYEPYYTTFMYCSNACLYCSDRFEVMENTGLSRTDGAVIRDCITGLTITVIDSQQAASVEADGPMILVDLSADEPFTFVGFDGSAWDDVTEDVEITREGAHFSGRLYRIRTAD